MNHPTPSLKVLVASLDWGLGHATRCIPIIKELQAQNCYVVLAGSGKVKSLLQTEFPELEWLELPGYNIRYSASGWRLPFKIVAQIPKLARAVADEHVWVKKVVEEHGINLIVSDNRFGLYHAMVPSVFITHQLQIKAPLAAAQMVLQKLNYGYINRFTACWVPDVEGELNLAGTLSHPVVKPTVPVHYVGPLSRFNYSPRAAENKRLLILLSGPEPQRTVLENLLLEQLVFYSGDVLLVRGLPGDAGSLTTGKNVTAVNHLPAQVLEIEMASAFMIISRCGYSTVMDIAALKKKSILIPTPGQTEQEYLAGHLMRMNFALCIAQKKFSLKAALNLAAGYLYKPFEAPDKRTVAVTITHFIKQYHQT